MSQRRRVSSAGLPNCVFNDPTVNPPEVDVFKLNNGRSELGNPNLSISGHMAAISVALGVGADDLALLLAVELPDDQLNRANLTRLYQASALAKALKMTVRDYVALRTLTGINPFEGVVATDSFVERARLVRESGFDLATLEYLLRHRVAAPAARTDAQISAHLATLRAGLEQIADLDNQQLTRDQFLDALAERAGWNPQDLDFLTGPNGFDLQFRDDFVRRTVSGPAQTMFRVADAAGRRGGRGVAMGRAAAGPY